MRKAMYGVAVCLALGGCVAEADLDGKEGENGDEVEDGDEPETAEVEQGLTNTLYDSRSFGGNIFSETFFYVTPQTCTPGFVRRSASTFWTSQQGGNCSFFGFFGGNPADCRANVRAQTAGGWFGGTCETFVVEVPGGFFNYAAFNTNNALQNTAHVPIFLTAGQTLTVGTCGLTDASASGDTMLRLIGPSGAQVAVNDDACGLGSRIVFVAQTTGFHAVKAGCFSSNSCSGQLVWNIN